MEGRVRPETVSVLSPSATTINPLSHAYIQPMVRFA